MRYFVKRVPGGYWVGQARGNNKPQGTIVKTKEQASRLITAWRLENSLEVK